MVLILTCIVNTRYITIDKDNSFSVVHDDGARTSVGSGAAGMANRASGRGMPPSKKLRLHKSRSVPVTPGPAPIHRAGGCATPLRRAVRRCACPRAVHKSCPRKVINAPNAFTFIMYYLYYYSRDHIESLLYNFWQAENDL